MVVVYAEFDPPRQLIDVGSEPGGRTRSKQEGICDQFLEMQIKFLSCLGHLIFHDCYI